MTALEQLDQRYRDDAAAGFDPKQREAGTALETDCRACGGRMLVSANGSGLEERCLQGCPPLVDGEPQREIRVLDTLRMLTTEPPEIDWLVAPFAARGHLTLFSGREKEGKSLVCQAIGAKMANGGGDLASLIVKPGKYLVIDAENAEPVVHRRMHSLALHADAAGRFISAVPPAGFDLRHDRQLIEQLLEQHRPDMLVLDSFRSLWGGKENESDETAAVLAPLLLLAQKYAVGIVLVHHMGKNPANGYRGSTAVGSTVEHLVSLAGMENDPDEYRRKMWTRSRLDESDSLWLRIERGEENGIIVEEAEPFGDSPAPATKSAKARQLLAEFLSDGNKHLASKAIQNGEAQGIPRKTTERASVDLRVQKTKTGEFKSRALWQLPGVSVQSGQCAESGESER